MEHYIGKLAGNVTVIDWEFTKTLFIGKCIERRSEWKQNIDVIKYILILEGCERRDLSWL